MFTLRKRWIGPREAERLLTAGPDASTHPELGYLLGAAAAPPRPDEVVGLWAAVAAFEEAGRATGVRVVPASRHWLARSVAVKAAAGVAVALIGGTALAAQTGNLPGGAQQRAHDLFSSLGVPPPGAGPAATGPSVDAPTPSPMPTPTAGPGNPGRTLSPSSPAVPELCRGWQANQQNPNNEPLAAEAFRELAAAAGGERRIAAFCAPLLADDPGRVVSPPGPTRDPGATPPTPSRPSGKGNDRPTPTPHRKG
ncbi:hypothetical protein WEI85_43485 [Actinomycetes bacterium KLBMP 9797]